MTDIHASMANSTRFQGEWPHITKADIRYALVDGPISRRRNAIIDWDSVQIAVFHAVAGKKRSAEWDKKPFPAVTMQTVVGDDAAMIRSIADTCNAAGIKFLLLFDWRNHDIPDDYDEDDDAVGLYGGTAFLSNL